MLYYHQRWLHRTLGNRAERPTIRTFTRIYHFNAHKMAARQPPFLFHKGVVMLFCVYQWDYDLDCYFLVSRFLTLEEAETKADELSVGDCPVIMKVWAAENVPMALDWTGSPLEAS